VEMLVCLVITVSSEFVVRRDHEKQREPQMRAGVYDAGMKKPASEGGQGETFKMGTTPLRR